MPTDSLRGFLREIAGSAYEQAPSSCEGGLPDRENCSWYHGAWPALRVLDLVSNPYWHYDFYSNSIQSAVDECGARSALVLGCADVSTAFLISNVHPIAVNITDICNTPLHWARVCASRFGFDWKTEQVDISQSMPSGRYDIVINDAFLTRFAENDKIHILRKIQSGLNPNGRYLTSARLANLRESDTGAYMSADHRRKWFVERGIAKFVEYGGLPGLDREQIEALLLGYMRSMTSYRFRDLAHVETTFTSAGFRISRLEEVIVPGESEESVYARIVATLK